MEIRDGLPNRLIPRQSTFFHQHSRCHSAEELGVGSNWEVRFRCNGQLLLVIPILDRTIVATHPRVPWTEFIIEKLRRNFMIIGTGTWQTLWDQPTKQALGFGSAQGQCKRDVTSEIRESVQIPTELLRRFNSDIILIPPATEEDYRDAASEFGLIKLALKLKVKLNFTEAA